MSERSPAPLMAAILLLGTGIGTLMVLYPFKERHVAGGLSVIVLCAVVVLIAGRRGSPKMAAVPRRTRILLLLGALAALLVATLLLIRYNLRG